MNLDEDTLYFHNENTIEHRKRKTEDQVSKSTITITKPVLRPMHGNSYSLLIAMLVAVRAYRMQQNEKDFNFTITLVDPEGGKFNDVVLRCPSHKLTVYMQCKHKITQKSSTQESISTANASNQETISAEKPNSNNSRTQQITSQNSEEETGRSRKKLKAEPSIIANAFLSANGPFSIPMYFISFLEMNSTISENNYYFLCTNAVIDQEIIEYFSEVDPNTNNIFSCYKELKGKFYRFNKDNQWLVLKEKLKNTSFRYLGKSLAKCIHGQHTISRTTQLYNMYSVLVNNIIERSDQTNAISSPTDQHTFNYKLKEAFQNAENFTDFGRLRETFSTEYQQLLGIGKNIWDDILQKGIKTDWEFSMSAMNDAFNLMNSESIYFAMVDTKIAEFYSKFRMICTPDEEILRRNAKQLLSELTDTEPEISFNSLYNSIFYVTVNSQCLQINSNFLNEMFQKLKRNTFYAQLKTSTNEYTETLKQKYPNGLINREWLVNSNFFQFLCNTSANRMYHYRSSVDLNVSAMIIVETLNLLKSGCLFIHESNFHQSKALEERLENVLQYNNTDLDSTLYIIVVLDKLVIASYNSLEELSRRHEQRGNSHMHQLVILTPSTEKEEPSEKSLLVRDLAHEARSKLFLDNKQLHFFGTSISIDSMIQETDDLSFMLNILDVYDETKDTDGTNINLHNYEKIRNSYVQRDVETYSPSSTSAIALGHSNREINICFEYLKDAIVHQTYSFDEMIETFDEIVCKPTYELVRTALSMREEEHDSSDLLDNDNKNKCVVLLDNAGSGKSTYFTWLAWRLSSLNSFIFIVRMNAIKYSSEFDRLQNIQNNLEDLSLVRTLYRFVSLSLAEPNINNRLRTERFRTELHEETRELGASLLCFSKGQVMIDETKTKYLSFEQLFELRLFCSKFNAKQLVLLLDAYDEICPNYTEIVIKCFAGFSKLDGIRNIYFSSRPHELQDDFKIAIKNCIFFQLQPFSHYHQILSLHKYFSNKVKEYENLETVYQPVVLGIVSTVLINRLDDLVKSPLLLHLAIDALIPIVRQHIQFSSHTISGQFFSNDKFQTFEIVELFVDRKLEILNTEKSGSTDTATRTVIAQRKHQLFLRHFDRVHAIMAIYLLFDRNYVDKIVSKQELQATMEGIAQGEEKAGIIVGVKNNIPIFAHRTFAEHMAARWLFKNQDKLRTDTYFKSQMFWRRGLDKVRDFFNHMICRENVGSVIHLAVLTKSLEELKASIEHNSSFVTVKDAIGRIPLLLALQHDNQAILLYLLEKMSAVNSINLVNEKDDLFRWSALDYAFVIWNKNAIQALLNFGACVDIAILREQLCSNDNDNLLIQAYHYINQLPSAEDRRHLAIWTVNYLYNERNLDINNPHERLEHSTVLKYCIAKHAYELFEQFILHLDNPSDYLSFMGNNLIQAALDRNAYKIVCFLIAEFGLQPPQIKNTVQLFRTVKSTIELGCMKSFQIFLDQLCFRLNVDCATDSMIVVNEGVENINTGSLDEANDQCPKSCCVRKSRNVLLPLPEYNEQNDFHKGHLFETLLARAAHEGNVHMMSHLVQKFQKPISNRTIVMVMRLLPKGKRLIHKQSVRAFQFLLNKTTDLGSIDEHGRNLLHMTIQNGCFFMVQCLLATDFDRTLINENNRWNIFHYIAASESKYNNRAIKLYQLAMSSETTERFDSVDLTGNSVYETAVINYNFDIAREMIESTEIDPTTSKRVKFVLDTVNRLVEQLNELEAVLEYFKYLFQFGDIAWMKAYSTIRQSVLIT